MTHLSHSPQTALEATMLNRRGFTLIELLLATVLTSVLMVGVLMVITRISVAPASPDQETADEDELTRAFRTLSRDLQTARNLEVDGQEIRMMAYGGLDASTRERTQHPAAIRYYTQRVAGRSWLMREERSLVGKNTASLSIDPVAAEITRVELFAMPVDTGSEELSSEPPADEPWKIRLWSADPTVPAVEQALLLRRGLNP